MRFTTTEQGTGWEAQCDDVPRLHRFRWSWSGGPFIEVRDDGGDGAFEALNVWDYETDRPADHRGQRRRVEQLLGRAVQ